MVRILKQKQQETVSATVAALEDKTSAKVVVVIAPESDVLREYTLLFSLFVGTVLALVLWKRLVLTSFPDLLLVQVVPIALVLFVPWVHHMMLKLSPKRLVHHHAARRAYEEYILVTHALPPSTPVVLLYISLAERYVHVLASQRVREKVPHEQWEKIVSKFTSSVKGDGLEKTTVEAVGSIGNLLISHFPK